MTASADTPIELIPQKYRLAAVADLTPHPDNPNQGDVDGIGSSIDALGFYGAVLVQTSTGRILAGEHRWRAAVARGASKLPAIFLDVDNDVAARILLGDNRWAARAIVDQEKLSSLLQSFDGDLAGTGYSVDDLTDLLGEGAGAGAGLTHPDAVPVSAPSITVPGDVWLLGPHRVCCGDATSPTDMARLLPDGELVHLVWTDPPYNVAIEGAAGTILNDDLADTDFADLIAGAMTSAFAALRKGGAIYVAHADTERLVFTSAFVGAGFKLSGIIVWRKNALVLGRSDYQWQHEPILYGWKPGGPHRWYGGRARTTIADATDSPFRLQPDGSWHIVLGDRILVVTGTDVAVAELEGSVQEYDRPSRSELHPTMKPTALIARHLLNSSRAGDRVLDLFGGSGSTLIAAHSVGRVARIMELDPTFVDVICRRFQEYSGVVPIAEATGRPHSFVTEEADGTEEPARKPAGRQRSEPVAQGPTRRKPTGSAAGQEEGRRRKSQPGAEAPARPGTRPARRSGGA